MDSRIIIDAYAWYRLNPNKQVNLTTLTKSNKKAAIVDDPDDYDEYDEDEDDYDDDCYSEEDDIEDEGQVEEEKNAPAPLNDDQLFLCGASVKGYS